MLRALMVQDFKDRVDELAYTDPAAGVEYATRAWPKFTEEELRHLVTWLEHRGSEAFRSGEEAAQVVFPPDAPQEIRRGLLAGFYEGYERLRRRLSGVK